MCSHCHNKVLISKKRTRKQLLKFPSTLPPAKIYKDATQPITGVEPVVN